MMRSAHSDFVLEGARLRIRPTLTDTELDYVLELEHHEENRRFIGNWTRRQHEEFSEDEDHLHLIIESKESGRPEGYMLIKGVCLNQGCIELTRLVVDSKGRGYGREAIQLVKDWAFSIAGAHRLQLDVRSINSRAKALYESEGFNQEGILRDCFKEEGGEGYTSLYLMSILEEEYRHV
ncbi:GNAT family protein [Paenibacillus sp. M1]|uniref:GNAT family protein n=1 Tax=Paenibacillus haidiansis TaxID=1574488 RepID=A0ABU7VVE9_9BACL